MNTKQLQAELTNARKAFQAANARRYSDATPSNIQAAEAARKVFSAAFARWLAA